MPDPVWRSGEGFLGEVLGENGPLLCFGATCPGGGLRAFVAPAQVPCGYRLNFCCLFRAIGVLRTEPGQCLGLWLVNQKNLKTFKSVSIASCVPRG